MRRATTGPEGLPFYPDESLAPCRLTRRRPLRQPHMAKTKTDREIHNAIKLA